MKVKLSLNLIQKLKRIQPLMLLAVLFVIVNNYSFSNNKNVSSHTFKQSYSKFESAPHASQSFERIQFLKEPEQKESIDDNDSNNAALFSIIYSFFTQFHIYIPQFHAHNDHLYFVKTDIALFLLFQSWEIYS